MGEGKGGGTGSYLLFALCPSNMLVYLRYRFAQTSARAATLREKLQTKFSISPSHSILTPDRPVSVLTLSRQAPGRADTAVLIFCLGAPMQI